MSSIIINSNNKNTRRYNRSKEDNQKKTQSNNTKVEEKTRILSVSKRERSVTTQVSIVAR